MRDESGHPDERKDDPMTAQRIIEDISDPNHNHHRGVKPKKHAHGISRPEVFYNPPDKSPIKKRLIKNMNYEG